MDSKSKIVNVGESVGQSEDSRSVGRKIWKETNIDNDYKEKEQMDCLLSKEKKVIFYER